MIENILAQLNEAAIKVKEQIRDIDSAISDATRERNDLTSQPVSREDFIGYIRDDIKRKSELFLSNLSRNISKAALQGFGQLDAFASSGAGINVYYENGFAPGIQLSNEAAHFYFEEVILQGVERAASGIEFNPDAVPIADRKRLIVELDAKIESLHRERDALAERLISAGVQG